MFDKAESNTASDNAILLSSKRDINLNFQFPESLFDKIIEAKIKPICENYLAESSKVIEERIQFVSDQLKEKINKTPRIEEALVDPYTQSCIYEAQVAAAITNEETGLKMIAELLAQQMEDHKNNDKKALVKKAIKIIPELSKDSLIGMCLIANIYKLNIRSWSLNHAIKHFEEIIKRTSGGYFPSGTDWIENLELQGVARPVPTTHTWVSYHEAAKTLWNGICCSGIDASCHSHQEILQELERHPHLKHLYIPHELHPNHFRISCTQWSCIEEIEITFPSTDGGITYAKLNDNDKEIVRWIISKYKQSIEETDRITDLFIIKLKERPILAQLLNWHQALPLCYCSTRLGKFIFSNMSRKLNLSTEQENIELDCSTSNVCVPFSETTYMTYTMNT